MVDGASDRRGGHQKKKKVTFECTEGNGTPNVLCGKQQMVQNKRNKETFSYIFFEARVKVSQKRGREKERRRRKEP